MSEVKLLPLPPLPEKESDERGEEWIEPQIEAYATAYARANMEPLLAENERLREQYQRAAESSEHFAARAERLAEALRLGLAIAEDGGTWSELGRKESARFKALARAALDQEGGNG